MVEIFKTNIWQKEDASPVIKVLLDSFPLHKINLDLEDRDKVLRVEGEKINAKEIVTLLEKEGFECAV